MSSVDLGSSKASSSTYLPTSDGQIVKPNANYVLSFLVSRLSINDIDAVEGDFIRFKTDYGQVDKTVSFNKSVVIGNDLFLDGEITISDELELYFNGFTWQDNCSSSAAIPNVGVFTASLSKQVQLVDLINATANVPLYLTIEVVAGCGGTNWYRYSNPEGGVANSYDGGAGGGYAAVEMVVLPDNFPKINFTSGGGGPGETSDYIDRVGPGGDSYLHIDDIEVMHCIGGRGGTHTTAPIVVGSSATISDAMRFLYSETVVGGSNTAGLSYSDEIKCKYRTIPAMYNSYKYYRLEGYTALGTHGGLGGTSGGSGYWNGDSGLIQITYRPATADEIAAQEALNAA